MVVTRRNGNPGMPASNHFKVMYAGAKKIGYKRVHTNYMAINTRPADERGFCIQQGFCVQGCKTGAKWSTLYTEIPRAEATGNLDLRIKSRATRIEHGADGRVNGVVYRDAQGKEQRQKARIVCVACNSIETARLLLLSESSKFPQGLANSHDQVGRHYTHHVGGFVLGHLRQAGLLLAGRDARRHRRGRDLSRSETRLRRRLSPGAGRARPAHVSRSWACRTTVGPRPRLRSWTTTGTSRACSSTAKTCRAPTIASRSTRK